MDLKEKKLESTTLYEGKIIDVYKDKVLCPNGHISYREYIKHCKASCVIAKKDNGNTPYYLHLRGYGERNQGMVQDHQYCRPTVKRAGIV